MCLTGLIPGVSQFFHSLGIVGNDSGNTTLDTLFHFIQIINVE